MKILVHSKTFSPNTTMSNPLYDEVPEYRTLRDKLTVHNSDTEIRGFWGPYFFLSNFYKTPVYYCGFDFPTSEHAYMFAKANPSVYSQEDLTELHRLMYVMTASDVKKFSRSIKLRPDWESVKVKVMAKVLMSKFGDSDILRERLLETSGKTLVEANFWKDDFWGVCYEKGGFNKLGELLMTTRSYFRTITHLQLN